MNNTNLVTALEALGEKIQDQNASLRVKDILIKELEQKVAELEAKLDKIETF